MASGAAVAVVEPAASTPSAAEVTVPGSKSYTNRALVLAALTRGPVEILGLSESDDSAAMLACLHELGIAAYPDGGRLLVTGDVTHIDGRRHYTLNADLAGTTLRFLLALACVTPGTKTILGKPALNARPVRDLVDGLRQLGAAIDYLEREGRPPLQVRSSRLTGSYCRMRGDVSSQYFSALLMIAPLVGQLVIDVVGEQTSKPYIDMTLSSMAAFGVRRVKNQAYRRYVVEPDQAYTCSTYTVEGDWSCAGYFLALAALTERTITVHNLDPTSAQADRRLCGILEQMGNQVRYGRHSVTLLGRGVAPVDVDMNDCPDQIQTVAVLAAFAPGVTRIRGAHNLREKETDRLAALERELANMGIEARASAEGELLIHGGHPRPATIHTYGDHRMAMAFALAGTRLKGLRVLDPGVVGKSYPGFWDTLRSTGVGVDFRDGVPL